MDSSYRDPPIIIIAIYIYIYIYTFKHIGDYSYSIIYRELLAIIEN